MNNRAVIGIDFGTQYCRAAIFRNGTIEPIPNAYGSIKTLSNVEICQSLNKARVGCPAPHSRANSISEIKRVIGRDRNDSVVKSYFLQNASNHLNTRPNNHNKNYTNNNNNNYINNNNNNYINNNNNNYINNNNNNYSVDNNPKKNNNFSLIPKDNGEGFRFEFIRMEQRPQMEPEEIVALIFAQIKKDAEAYLGTPVTEAVVSVPVCYTDSQRQATKDAATIAGLNVLRLLSDTMATFLDRFFRKPDLKDDSNVLVLDVGHSGFSVSLSNYSDGIFEALSVSGNTSLGGRDFDTCLIEYVLSEFWQTSASEARYETGGGALSRLQTERLQRACERAKIQLSSEPSASIRIEALHGGADFQTDITRSDFDRMTKHLNVKIVESALSCLSTHNVSPQQVHRVVLAGGTAHICQLQEMLAESLGAEKLDTILLLDYEHSHVARGAAIQAALLGTAAAIENTRIADWLLLEVTPHSVGIETAGGVMTPLIRRNTTLPCLKRQTFTTYTDNNGAIVLQVFEGEKMFGRDCHRLGAFEVSGLPPAPRGVPQVEITFSLDANGIMTATGVDRSNRLSLVVLQNKGRLSTRDIVQLVKVHAKIELENPKDPEAQLSAALWTQLRQVAHAVRDLSQMTQVCSESKDLLDKLFDVETWIQQNSSPSPKIVRAAECETQLTTFNSLLFSTVGKIYSTHQHKKNEMTNKNNL